MSDLMQQFRDAFASMADLGPREHYAAQRGLFDEHQHPRDNRGEFTSSGAAKPGVAGQQMGLFSQAPSGQGQLFNMVPPAKSRQKTGRKISNEGLKAITAGLDAKHREFLAKKETVSPADRNLIFQQPSLEGQKEMFSRIRDGIDCAFLYAGSFDPSKHPGASAGSPQGGQFTKGPTSGDLSQAGVSATINEGGKSVKVHGLTEAIDSWWKQNISKDVAAPTTGDLSKRGLVAMQGKDSKTVKLKGLADAINSFWREKIGDKATPRMVDGIPVNDKGEPVDDHGQPLTGDSLRQKADDAAGQKGLFDEPPKSGKAKDSPAPVTPDPREKLPGAKAPLEKVHDVPGGRRIGAAQINVQDLKADPHRFQYKISGIGDEGITDELKSVKSFNPMLGGQLLVWQDPEDHQTYVVNGHHRFELAARSAREGTFDGNLSVYYVNAPDAQQARAYGALANIAEGRGTAVDAAKFLRDSKMSPQQLQDKHGVSLTGAVARDGVALTKLSDKLFQKLTQEEISQGRALAIANHLPDHEKQNDLLQLIKKNESKTGKTLSDAAVSEMGRMLNVTPVKKSSGGLFGGMEEPLIAERGQLVAGLRKSLTGEKNIFKQASTSRRASVLESAGDNKLDVAANREQAKTADLRLWDFDKRINASGDPLAKAVSDASVQWSEAKTEKQRRAIEKQLEQQARQFLKGSDEPGAKPGSPGPDQRQHEKDDGSGSHSARDKLSRRSEFCRMIRYGLESHFSTSRI